jgi:4-carboxymuconolactone decarboxylase
LRERLERTVLPRLTSIDPQYEEGVAAALAGAMPPGVPPLLLRTIAHHPRILEMMRASQLLDRGSLALRHRAIVILRTTARCTCGYKWCAPASLFAAHSELRQSEMAVIAYGGAADPAWSQPERTLIRVVDELHDTARISDALWTDLRRHWSDAQLVELIVLVGFYHTISFVVNGLCVKLEPTAASVSLGRILEPELETLRT